MVIDGSILLLLTDVK